ncbi:hypothetical protein AVEN_139968-1 [Araneus ventricosus]|uniref:CCHC-type domain-containing protein n=1 Tax=Araneus ventricosus TaxID=182803 RepID=A0A4Y2U9Z4_ARAVE|nr:hypothetical protein AVEN_139968-1 [Araneus ventricosus]
MERLEFLCKKAQKIPALLGENGFAYSDSNKAETIALSIEKQFSLNDLSHRETENEVKKSTENFPSFPLTNNRIDNLKCIQPSEQTIQFPELKVSSITNVPLPGIRPPSGAMGPKNYLITDYIEHHQVFQFNYTCKPTDVFKNVPFRKAAKQRKIEFKSPIKTANKFSVLMNDDDQEMQCSAPLEPPKEIIPVINLKITEDYNLTLQEISRNFPETVNHYVRGYIRISPNSSEERTKIMEYLDKNEKEYVLSEAPTERPIRIVIKGVPPDHCREKITQELESLNYKVLRINHLRNYYLKTFHPIVLVELAKTPNVEKIFKINKVNILKVTIEAYRRKQRATICFNCSDFYHSARNCKRKQRCIKCNVSHETRNCDIKTIIENPSCINCNEKGHLASWRGCPKFPVIKINKAPTYAQRPKPILKLPGKDPTDTTNYRPISLLPSLSKIAEHLILKRLNNYLGKITYFVPNNLVSVKNYLPLTNL